MQPAPHTWKFAAILCLLATWLPGRLLADLATTRLLETTWRNGADLRGEAIDLQAADDSFIALHHAAQGGSSRGAVVILHGPHGNADSDEVVRPLRLGLAAAGWETLAPQLPSGSSARPANWQGRDDLIGARINAALDWLQARGQERIAIVAVGEAGPIALSLAPGAPSAWRALVLLSNPAVPDQATLDTSKGLALPILDLYAERDIPAVLDSVDQRRTLLRTAGAMSLEQRMLPGARPGYRDLADELLATVRDWLGARIPQQEGP